MPAVARRRTRRRINPLAATMVFAFVVFPGLGAVMFLTMLHLPSCEQYARDGTGTCIELSPPFDPTISLVVLVASVLITTAIVARWWAAGRADVAPKA
jgi:hypothetical protein